MSGWRDHAYCAGADVDMFPAKGEHAKRVLALSFCAECTVRLECLQDAVRSEGDREFGIRGGLSAKDRRLYKRGRLTTHPELPTYVPRTDYGGGVPYPPELVTQATATALERRAAGQRDWASATAQQFGCSREALRKWLQKQDGEEAA